MIDIPLYVSEILNVFYSNGYEAFLVGGCVRDSLLGNKPKDYDITTNAKPETIKSLLNNFKTIDTGIDFGTVTAISDGHPIEITTYRIDGDYFDNRRPENVIYTQELKEDLKRRDFTVNSMAFSPGTGLIDLFGGQSDLETGIIRAIGNPEERFNEDGLRIMRALRFASRYGFRIDSETSKAIHNLRGLLSNIAVERVSSELNQILCGKCENILREFSDVFAVFIPEIEDCIGFEQYTKYHDRDVYEHIIATVCAIEPVKHLRLAMLFHDIGKPRYFKLDEKGQGHFKMHAVGSCEIAERVLKILKYDSQTIQKVIELVKNHDIVIENRDNLIKRYLNRFREDMFFDLISVHIADDSGKAIEYQNRIEIYKQTAESARRIIAESQCFSLKNLSVNGHDVISLGYKGKIVGDILNELLEKVIDGKIENKKDILINEIKNMEVKN